MRYHAINALNWLRRTETEIHMYEDQQAIGASEVTAVGSRLRRLSDRWDRQIRELYDERSFFTL